MTNISSVEANPDNPSTLRKIYRQIMAFLEKQGHAANYDLRTWRVAHCYEYSGQPAEFVDVQAYNSQHAEALARMIPFGTWGRCSSAGHWNMDWPGTTSWMIGPRNEGAIRDDLSSLRTRVAAAEALAAEVLHHLQNLVSEIGNNTLAETSPAFRSAKDYLKL